MVVLSCSPAPRAGLWIAGQVRNDGPECCLDRPRFPDSAGMTVAIVVSLCMVVMFVCRLFLLVVSNGNVIIGVAY